MHREHAKNKGISFKSILKRFLSVKRMAINIGMIAIENLKNKRVGWSIPFWNSVRTKTPLDPNMKPARIGKIK